MGYTASSFSAGQQPTTAQWNVLWANDASFNDGTGIANLEVGSGHTALKLDYKFWVYRNAAWSAPSNTNAIVAYDTTSFDTGSNVDIVTNKGRFTAPISGYYFFNARVVPGGTTTVRLRLALYKNGSEILAGGDVNSSGNNNNAPMVTGFISLAAADYVEVNLFSSASGSMATGGNNIYFQGYLVSTT